MRHAQADGSTRATWRDRRNFEFATAPYFQLGIFNYAHSRLAQNRSRAKLTQLFKNEVNVPRKRSDVRRTGNWCDMQQTLVHINVYVIR